MTFRETQKNLRALPDFIEPFVVKKLQRINNTFCVYRCSDYVDVHQLCEIHKLNINLVSKFIPLLDTYWSAIDIIYFKITELPEYSPTQDYFRFIEKLQTKEKTVIDIDLYEVKSTTNSLIKPILTVRTKECSDELLKLNKSMLYVKVILKHPIEFDIDYSMICLENFQIKTHYGRKGYSLTST